MNPTRGNSSPAWCSTLATTRRGLVRRTMLYTRQDSSVDDLMLLEDFR